MKGYILIKQNIARGVKYCPVPRALNTNQPYLVLSEIDFNLHIDCNVADVQASA